MIEADSVSSIKYQVSSLKSQVSSLVYKMIPGPLRDPGIQNPNLINYDTITGQM